MDLGGEGGVVDKVGCGGGNDGNSGGVGQGVGASHGVDDGEAGVVAPCCIGVGDKVDSIVG